MRTSHRPGDEPGYALKSHGVIPVAYGDGVADRIRAAAPGGMDAVIDTHGKIVLRP